MRLKSKIPNITILATTTTTLTAVANKIPNVGNLIKKTDYNTKLMKLKKKLIMIIVITILLHKSFCTSKFIKQKWHCYVSKKEDFDDEL